MLWSETHSPTYPPTKQPPPHPASESDLLVGTTKSGEESYLCPILWAHLQLLPLDFKKAAIDICLGTALGLGWAAPT